MADIHSLLIAQAESADGQPYNRANRELVISHLHYSGSNRHRLTDNQFVKAYLLCNGFGDIDLQFAAQIEFDWSHVRDSSPLGIDRAANYIKTLL